MTTFQVPERMNFSQVAPKVFKAVLALDAASRDGLDPVLLELVQIRASQINKCAYCIDYHTGDARKAGESEERIYQLSAWQEASLYTAKERAALALTEEVTQLPGGGGHRRCLRRGREALRGQGAGPADRADLHRQRVEWDERRHPQDARYRVTGPCFPHSTGGGRPLCGRRPPHIPNSNTYLIKGVLP